MRRIILWSVILAASWTAHGAERLFDFSKPPLNQTPPGYRSTVTGEGKPGEWKVIMDEVTPLIPRLTPNAPMVTKQAVLAQLSQDRTDEHFPLLILDEESYGDFKLTLRFKTVSGEVERMAGIAFRIQDEKNYYVVRASSLGNTFRFYKVVQGIRSQPIGPQIVIPSGVWHEMTVQCAGNQIHCFLNGKEAIPTLTDNSFNAGKIGLWTKSDSVSYFTDLRLTYTPRVPLAQVLVKDMMARYPRLIGIRIYSTVADKSKVFLIASNDPKDIGDPGGTAEREVIEKGSVYFGHTRKTVTATLPLRDRNGDPVAAVRVEMERFPGQTESNAIARAVPIVKEMEKRVPALSDLLE